MSMTDALASHVDATYDELVDVRRELHRTPELSFQETMTSAVILDRLAAIGLDPAPCPTQTGAVCALEGGRRGRTVLLRADIDGLPVHEDNGLPFASRVEGTMHACGHDAHTAIALGVASALASHAEELPGRYVFVFQPAEETVSGAQAMVDGGLLDRYRPEAAIGCHVASALPVGLVVARSGLHMAGVRGLRVSVEGSGGHGALQPRQGNVVLAVARFADLLDRVVTELESDGTPCVCSPGVLSAGSAPNVVPTEAILLGTLRFFEPEQLTEAERRLRRLAEDVMAEFGVTVRVEQTYRTDAVRNDAALTEIFLGAAKEVLGDSRAFAPGSPTAASDDMSVFLDRVPGCYAFVGAALPDGSSGNHHSPAFAIDEEALRTGSKALAAAAVALASQRD